MGYHIREIETQGVYGQSSKIREELEEFEEALEQGNYILALVELADLYGALEGVAEAHNVSMGELAIMSAATRRAFEDGTRTAKFPKLPIEPTTPVIEWGLPSEAVK
jgi:hypothetical protein